MINFNGLTHEEKTNLARRDDCLSVLVPSDIRVMLGRIKELEQKLSYAAETLDLLNGHTHPSIECDAIAAECRELLNVSERAENDKS
jgi:hypothetical protein